jgi:HAD superfamily hydrolase (TIGR01509 family)
MFRWPLAVFFDFDGVIVNSEPLHYHAFHDVLAAEQIELSEAEYYRELIGVDDRGGFTHIFQKRGRPLDRQSLVRLVTLKSQAMMKMIQHRRPGALPGVEELVRGLRRHYPLAICSGAMREEIESMLETAGLRDCFEIIVAAGDVTVGKPDPEGYLLAAQRVGERCGIPLEPADCLVIEDAPSVIQSIRTVGFKTLAVATTYPIDKLSGADWAVSSLRPEEVLAKLPALNVFT